MLLFFCALFFLGLFVFPFAQRFFITEKGTISLPRLDLFSSAFLCLSIVLGGTFMYATHTELPIYTWIIILLLLGGLFCFTQKELDLFKTNLIRLLLCVIGVFGVLLPMPNASFSYWLAGGILTVVWFLGWRLISNFDKYPLTSYVVSSGWTVALLMVGFVVKTFPSEIVFFATVLGISIFVISTKRLTYGFSNLGARTSEISGFIWSGIWTIFLLQSSVVILVLIYGYYFVEMTVLLVEYLKKRQLKTLLLQSLVDDKKRKKAIYYVFIHVVIMAFLAAALPILNAGPNMTVYATLLLGGAICCNLYNHLKNPDRSLGSWREIFSELKTGVSELPKASKAFAKEVKSGLKTQSRKKKVSGKKKGVKKKK